MIRTTDPFNAFLPLPPGGEPAPAAHAPGGPLAGMRLAVKDIFDVAGWPTGGGNPQKRDEAEPAQGNAPVVQRLLDAGAEFAGKTQTDELAFSLMGQNSHFPHPINPAAPGRITGGSSSGSAAAVAAGLAEIGLGSDTGGSIRAPASFCGLWGIRPTHGRLPLDGVMPLAPSLDTAGFLARDLPSFSRVAGVLFGEAEEQPVRLLRFPALEDLLLPQAAAEYGRLLAVVTGALGAAQSQAPPLQAIDDLYWCFRRIQGFEAWAAHGAWLSEKDRGLGPGVKERFEAGAQISAETYDAEMARREGFREALRERLGADGVMVLPTVPGAALLAASSQEEFGAFRERCLKMLCWSGLSGFPQVNLPLGQSEGAPFGISLLGPPGSDERLVALAGRVAGEGAWTR